MLRERVKESLTREKEQALKEKRRRAALDGLLALNPVDAPESMVDAEVDSALKEYARYAARQGVDLKGAQIDWNNLRTEARPSAVRRVKEYLLLDAIGEAEKIEVTDTELDAELKRRAGAMGATFSQLKAALVKNERLESVREEIRIEKVMDFLLAEATAA
jgi:trigger factor